MTTRQQVIDELIRTKEITNTFFELNFCLDIWAGTTDDREDQSLSEAIDEVQFIFACEWDCDLKSWADGTF